MPLEEEGPWGGMGGWVRCHQDTREASEVQVYQAPERSQQASHLGPGGTCPGQGAVSAKAVCPVSPRATQAEPGGLREGEVLQGPVWVFPEGRAW